jgi:hypothetical protein
MWTDANRPRSMLISYDPYILWCVFLETITDYANKSIVGEQLTIANMGIIRISDGLIIIKTKTNKT